ncbi:MAG: type II/IV secretion system ATPase subunit [Nitrososphaerota archaeon]|nr:type II/IV secretion system ATPase subunit [Nitrososphaerota archaeon]
MKPPAEGTMRRTRLWVLAAVICYLIAEVVSLGIFRVTSLPISYLVGDVLGLGAAGALAVLSSAIIVAVGAEGMVLSSMRRPLQAAQAAKVAPVSPQGIESSSINRMLGDSSQNFVEVFPLRTGVINVYGAITKEEGMEGYRYIVIEPELTPQEKKQFAELKELLIEEMDVDLRSIETREKAEAFLTNKVAELAQSYGFNISKPSMRKLQYYFSRDFINLGKIDPIMLDPLIEDISCDGAKIPIYIWHRDYESIPTNVVFDTDQELDTFVSKLAYVSGKHISLALPIVDASLQDGSRLHLTYGKEITQKGSTFTIRKFKSDPFTVVDLIKYNTLNPEVAAYFWYLIEKRLSILVAGSTASGKTTTMNCLSMFITPGQKVISVEDTPELSLPQENWIQEVTRAEGAVGEITLFDLVRNSLRQRPDVIIVGEIRGKEAFSLFQAISTGHGGFSTIHADSVEAVFNRLTTEPMNIPRSMVGTSLDCIVLELKLRIGDRSVRRIISVNEILGYDNRTNEMVMNEVFRWDPVTDRLVPTGRSRLVDKINLRYGLRPEEIRRDIESRKVFLEWLASKNYRSYKEVSQYVMEFYANPYAMASRARTELEAATQ